MVGGWAFRQVLDDVMSQHTEDQEMAGKFVKAEEEGYLAIDMLDPELADRITVAIRQVVTGILAGTIRSGLLDKAYGTSQATEQYLKALRKLLEEIPGK